MSRMAADNSSIEAAAAACRRQASGGSFFALDHRDQKTPAGIARFNRGTVLPSRD